MIHVYKLYMYTVYIYMINVTHLYKSVKFGVIHVFHLDNLK